MALFECRHLQVHYGGIRAVRGVSFGIEEGEIVCLIGANGAGKTSTLKAIARLLPSSGEIEYRHERIDRLPAYSLIAKGLALVPEGRGVFTRLTVMENLALGAWHRSDAIDTDITRVFDLLPRLAERAQQLAGTLSGGEQQMLAIGRALMGRPRLLLLDEPSMGLAPLMIQKVFEVIRAVAKEGVTILLVEQNARLALETCHRGYVMEGGRIILMDSAKNLMTNSRIREIYLGGER